MFYAHIARITQNWGCFHLREHRSLVSIFRRQCLLNGQIGYRGRPDLARICKSWFANNLVCKCRLCLLSPERPRRECRTFCGRSRAGAQCIFGWWSCCACTWALTGWMASSSASTADTLASLNSSACAYLSPLIDQFLTCRTHFGSALDSTCLYFFSFASQPEAFANLSCE